VSSRIGRPEPRPANVYEQYYREHRRRYDLTADEMRETARLGAIQLISMPFGLYG